MNSASVFVYGTLLDPSVRRHAIGKKVSAEPASVSGFTREHVQHPRAAFTLVKRKGAQTHGKVFRASDADLERLDKWESDYTRQPVRLDSGRKAFAYIENGKKPVPRVDKRKQIADDAHLQRALRKYHGR